LEVRTDIKAIIILNTQSETDIPCCQDSQDGKVDAKENQNKMSKVPICKTRMPVNFNELCTYTYMTTKCYTGQMLGVWLEITETKPLEGIPMGPACCRRSGLENEEHP
jgi:hypothetical protein